MPTRSISSKEADAFRKWWIVDAKDQPLGRLASRIAGVLRGKHRATFTPNADTGDFVIVINAAKAKMTGQKATTKLYQFHSSYPGGIRAEAYRDIVRRRPEYPIRKAVKGMLPKNVLSSRLITKLKIYAGPDHPHTAQKPETLQVG